MLKQYTLRFRETIVRASSGPYSYLPVETQPVSQT